jgi:hypothetical protein
METSKKLTDNRIITMRSKRDNTFTGLVRNMWGYVLRKIGCPDNWLDTHEVF